MSIIAAVSALPENPTASVYDPSKLLDAVIVKLNLRNDAALARALGTTPPMISKIRHKRVPVAASLLIAMHEETGFSIAHLRELMGDRRTKYRISPVHFKPRGAQDASD